MLLALAFALSPPGLYETQPIRYELVYQMAGQICPIMSKYPNKKPPQVARVLRMLHIEAQFTADEARSMLNHCIMYSRGRHSRP